MIILWKQPLWLMLIHISNQCQHEQHYIRLLAASLIMFDPGRCSPLLAPLVTCVSTNHETRRIQPSCQKCWSVLMSPSIIWNRAQVWSASAIRRTLVTLTSDVGARELHLSHIILLICVCCIWPKSAHGTCHVDCTYVRLSSFKCI